jgi:hypothetical protein
MELRLEKRKIKHLNQYRKEMNEVLCWKERIIQFGKGKEIKIIRVGEIAERKNSNEKSDERHAVQYRKEKLMGSGIGKKDERNPLQIGKIGERNSIEFRKSWRICPNRVRTGREHPPHPLCVDGL